MEDVKVDSSCRFNEREFPVRSIKLLHELDAIGGGISNKTATYFGLCRW